MVLLVLGVVWALVGCQATDVVGKGARTSFEAVLTADADQVQFDELAQTWALNSPEGERFLWRSDSSGKQKPMVGIEFDASAFLEAGMDTARLDQALYRFDASNNLLQIQAELAPGEAGDSDSKDAQGAFTALVKSNRNAIGYHAALDHYGMKLGGGNMFEWAKDMSSNDKDMVFVLDAKALIDAGVDPSKVNGWIFAQVEIMDDQGKEMMVDKFLKPYNLK